MKIVVTGAQGNLGKELVRRGCEPINTDITNSELIRNEIEFANPDVLIHCAAITDVSYCEDHFKETFEVNVRGTANVVGAMPSDSLFIYISSDHVFSGDNWFNTGYGENHKPSPVNGYGFSKWGGELAARTGLCTSIVVRSSKCFDYNWAKPTMDLLRNDEEVVVTDLIKRSFVHTRNFVDGLLHLANHYKEYDEPIINISGDLVFSYYHFWVILQKELGLPGKIIPRREKLRDADPRPFRAGLETRLAQRLGIPIYNINSGIKLLKEGI